MNESIETCYKVLVLWKDTKIFHDSSLPKTINAFFYLLCIFHKSTFLIFLDYLHHFIPLTLTLDLHISPMPPHIYKP